MSARFVNAYQPGIALVKLLHSLDPRPAGAPVVLRMPVQTADGETHLVAELTEAGAELVCRLLEAEEDRRRAVRPGRRHLRLVEGEAS